MKSRRKRSKAFMFTIDALISFGIVIGLTNALVLLDNSNVDLNDVYLYQQAQDMMEVCSKLNQVNNDCLNQLCEMNPALECGCKSDDAVVVERQYLWGAELRICIKR